MYKAFISYSHAADGQLAPALQSGLQRIAKPFYRLRAMRLFRDDTNLHLTTELWPTIKKAVGESEHFILMASPKAAESKWVQDEVDERLRVQGGTVDKFHIVLTEGNIEWDNGAKDFNWEKTTALPKNLRGKFKTEPLHLDFRWARTSEHLSLRNPQFLRAVGRLAATIRDVPLDAIVGEDVRQHRVFKLVAGVTIILLSALLVVASVTAVYANERRKEADSERQKAVEAVERERQAADKERIAREEERKQRELAEKATENEKEARGEADKRRKDAEDALAREKVATAKAAEAARLEEIAKNQAEERRKEAEQRSRIALSRQLAAQSRSKLEYGIDPALLVSPKGKPTNVSDDPGSDVSSSTMPKEAQPRFEERQLDLALLLANEAVKTAPTTEAHNSLIHTLQTEKHLVKYLHTGQTYVTNLFPLKDQNTLVVGNSLKGLIEFWDSSTGRLLNRPVIDRGLGSMTVSADHRTIALINELRKTVTLVDLLSGKDVGKPLSIKGNLIGSRGAFSPDGKMLAFDRDGNTISLWDLKSRELIREWVNPGGKIQRLEFKPDGKTLLAINAEGEISFWNPTTTELVAKYKVGGSGWGATISISPDGTRLAVGSRQGIIYLWNLDKGEQVPAEIDAHTGAITGVAFSPGGRTLASVGGDKKVMLHDLSGESPKPTLLGTHRSDIESVAFQHDNLLATGDRSGEVALWQVPTAKILGQSYVVNDSYLPGMAMSPDGAMLAMGYEDGSIVLWDVHAKRQVGEPLRQHQGSAYSLAFSRDGLTLASGGRDGAVILWDLKTTPARGALLFRQEGTVSALAFSPDEKVLAVGTYKVVEKNSGASGFELHYSDFEIHLWDISSRKPIRPALTGHRSSISELAFSPDGSMLASGDHPDCRIILWNTATWEIQHQLKLPAVDSDAQVEYGISGLSFHPNGKILATSGGHTIAFWNVKNGRLEGPTRVPTYEIMATVDNVQFIEGGQFFVYSADSKVFIQDFDNRMTVGEPLIGHTATVSRLQVSPSNNVLVSSDYDGNLIIWDTNKVSLQNLACNRANRNMTYWEWKQTFPGQPYRKTCENIPIHDSILRVAGDIDESGDVESATAVFLEAQKAEPSLPLNVAKGHLGGTWLLDVSRSRGVSADVKQTMEINVTGDRIHIESKASKASTGESNHSTDDYILDLKERDFIPRWLNASDSRGKLRARWSADGNGIYVVEEATGTTPRGVTKAYRKRKLLMSPDGKTLTVLVYYGPADKTPTNVRTFIRQ